MGGQAVILIGLLRIRSHHLLCLKSELSFFPLPLGYRSVDMRQSSESLYAPPYACAPHCFFRRLVCLLVASDSDVAR